MEGQPSSALAITAVAARAEVDTTRPFRSVKEAVAVFGERFLTGDTHSRKTSDAVPQRSHAVSAANPVYAICAAKPLYSASSSTRSYSSSSSRFNQEREDEGVILNSIKKLEAELAETRRELKLLMERETETETAVASLNAELHKSVSKLAEIEAANRAMIDEDRTAIVTREHWGQYLPSLAEALSIGESYGGRTKPRLPKMKPIVPLITGIFSKKKVPADFDNAFFTRPISSNSIA